MKQKKQESRFLGALLAHLSASLMQPVMSSLGVTRAGRKYMDKNF